MALISTISLKTTHQLLGLLTILLTDLIVCYSLTYFSFTFLLYLLFTYFSYSLSLKYLDLERESGGKAV